MGGPMYTPRFTLYSSLPGKLTCTDYTKGSLASSFLLGALNDKAHTRGKQKGGEGSPGTYL